MKTRVLLINGFITLSLLLAAGGLDFAHAQQGSSTTAAPAMNWIKASKYGFGLSDNFIGAVTSLEEFNGYLYAGPTSRSSGTIMFRSDDGLNWQAASEVAFGQEVPEPPPDCGDYWYYIWDMAVFDDQLYATVGIACLSSWVYYGGMVVRTDDGTTWEAVVPDAFGSPDEQAINILTVFNGMIYTGTANITTGLQVWRSATGDIDDWEDVTPSNLAMPAHYYSSDFQEFNGALFMTTNVGATSGISQIWSTEDGINWEAGPMEMFTCEPNCIAGNLGVLDDTLYMGVWNFLTGGELWCTTDGTEWTLSASSGDATLVGIDPVGVYDGYLYLGVQDLGTGIGHLWRTSDGVTIENASLPGFDLTSGAAVFPNTGVIFQDHLYLGKYNWEIGGSIWRNSPFETWLPLMYKNTSE